MDEIYLSGIRHFHGLSEQDLHADRALRLEFASVFVDK